MCEPGKPCFGAEDDEDLALKLVNDMITDKAISVWDRIQKESPEERSKLLRATMAAVVNHHKVDLLTSNIAILVVGAIVESDGDNSKVPDVIRSLASQIALRATV